MKILSRLKLLYIAMVVWKDHIRGFFKLPNCRAPKILFFSGRGRKRKKERGRERTRGRERKREQGSIVSLRR